MNGDGAKGKGWLRRPSWQWSCDERTWLDTLWPSGARLAHIPSYEPSKCLFAIGSINTYVTIHFYRQSIHIFSSLCNAEMVETLQVREYRSVLMDHNADSEVIGSRV